ncbi:MAG TPA: hypothetical protein VHM92_03585 [Allosphingosinicella sp.]|nr:hypothetical protein [Allosphingosinicella sp.]
MMAEVTTEEQVAILRFAQSAVGRKFTAVTHEADVKILDMANHPSPEWLEQQAEAMRTAALAFIDAREK